jgi:hypothetical protein
VEALPFGTGGPLRINFLRCTSMTTWAWCMLHAGCVADLAVAAGYAVMHE